MPRKVEEGSRVSVRWGAPSAHEGRAGSALKAERGTWPLAFGTPLLGHGG